jgi:hypothetical protein
MRGTYEHRMDQVFIGPEGTRTISFQEIEHVPAALVVQVGGEGEGFDAGLADQGDFGRRAGEVGG